VKTMKSLQEVYDAISGGKLKKIAVSAAADLDVLTAVSKAREDGIAEAILVGDKKKIIKIANENNIDITPFEIIHIEDANGSALEAVKLVSSGKADIIMKGLMESAPFLKAILNPEFGIRQEGRIISSLAVMEVKELDRLLFITDPGFIPMPDLKMKESIIKNAVEVVRKLGIERPKIAMLCATETVNPKMIATVEAKELEEMNRNGEILNCVIAGPISLDLAISKQSAKHKGYKSEVAGEADVLVVPTLEVGNVLYKSLVYFAHLKTGGIMTGAKTPIIFTSRADSFETKLNTIALAVYLAQKE